MSNSPQTTIGFVYRLDVATLRNMRPTWVRMYGETSRQVAVLDHRIATAAAR